MDRTDRNRSRSRLEGPILPDLPVFRPLSFYYPGQDDGIELEKPSLAYFRPRSSYSSSETLLPSRFSQINLFDSQRPIIIDFPLFYPSPNASHSRQQVDRFERESPSDGGLRAWLVVLGGFLAYFATFGLLNTFGTFQAYYQKKMLPDTSGSVISWIGSLQVFILFIGGLVIGPMYDRYGATRIVVPGTLIYVLSMMLTSLSTKYYQLMLTQGVMFGIGNAMLFYPTISAVSQWFSARLGLALGIAVAGSSLGGICWPLLVQYLLDHVGFGWAVRTAGFICIGLLVPSCFLLVSRASPSSPDQSTKPRLDLVGILKDWKYIVFSAGMFLVLWGMFIPFFYLPLYGQYYGMSESKANYLLSYLNAGSFVARILTGIVADRFGRFNTIFVCALGCGILLFGLYGIKTPPTIISFSVLYGIFSGGLISLQSACVAQITPDTKTIGVRIGIMMAICSFGGLTGSPIGGALITRDHGGFTGLINFSAIILTAGAALILYARFLAVRRLGAF
ncbi:hypothetical protein VTN02DRAFT_1121 [Thermoascus thermophilus]